MSDFKVGDRVLITGYQGTPWEGPGTVTDVRSSDNTIIVRRDNEDGFYSEGGFPAKDLVSLEPVVTDEQVAAAIASIRKVGHE